MAEVHSYDIDGLRFERLAPVELEDRFGEIQTLRRLFYERVFRGKRSFLEVITFTDRLTRENWSQPNASVGKTAKEGQRRAEAQVLVAFDEQTNRIEGFMYSAENVSSRLELGMAKAHMPKALRSPIGNFERAAKLNRGRYYVWGSEYVHDPERTGLPPVLGALGLEGYDPNLIGTWYPWKEETELKRQLMQWGYRWDGNSPEPIPDGFGVHSRSTAQERWTAPVGYAVGRIEQLPGASVALEQARATMPQNPLDT